jgi:Rieske Fe-S protein
MNSTGTSEGTEIPAKNLRRTFLNRLWSILGTLAFLEFGWFSLSILNAKKERHDSQEKDKYVSPGTIENFHANSVTAIPNGRFYLACLEDGSFLALSRTCTHLGCSVHWDENKKFFTCPCHGSSFDLAGEVLTPPATRALDSYPLRIEDGVIRVNVSRSIKHLQDGKSRSVKV